MVKISELVFEYFKNDNHSSLLMYRLEFEAIFGERRGCFSHQVVQVDFKIQVKC